MQLTGGGGARLHWRRHGSNLLVFARREVTGISVCAGAAQISAHFRETI